MNSATVKIAIFFLPLWLVFSIGLAFGQSTGEKKTFAAEPAQFELSDESRVGFAIYVHGAKGETVAGATAADLRLRRPNGILYERPERAVELSDKPFDAGPAGTPLTLVVHPSQFDASGDHLLTVRLNPPDLKAYVPALFTITLHQAGSS